jgi:hypothetical protein
MTADVWIEIQEHESMLRAVQDEVLLIVFGVARDQAKHTIIRLWING